ncbi:MAG: alpha/beta hydrolase-fold protein [Chitinophagaceae bacterium]
MFAQQNSEKAVPLTIGETRTIKSAILGEDRLLNIYLPGKFSALKAYPVIYLLDGSIDEDFIHITGLVQFFNLMFAMPDFIIVGISNVDRKRDFTFPTKEKELKEKYPTTGGSEKFIAFIENELQPYINSVYTTTNTKYLIGQSLGGLLATEILLKKSELFSHYFIISPSLWWDNESLLKQADALLKYQKDGKRYVYISVGSEGKIMESDAASIAQKLKEVKKKNLKVDFLPLPKENHATILHQSIYEALKIQFPYKE